MKMAIEAQREERRKSEANRGKAIAFEIDLTSDNVQPKNLKVRGGEASEPTTSQKSNNPRSGKNIPPPEEETPPPLRNKELSNKEQPKGSQKKGWGPPVDANDILQARGMGGRSKESKVDEIFDRPMTPQEYENEFAGDNSPMVEDESQEILKRIESKRRSQLEVRHQAREVLSKLREQRQQQANKGKPATGQSSSSSSKRNASPMRAKVQDVMNSVEAARESVQKVVSESRLNRDRRDSDASRDASPGPSQVRSNNSRQGGMNGPKAENVDGKLVPIEELTVELEDTLTNWLEKQKRAVTVRKKPVKPAGVPLPSSGYPRDSKSLDDFKDDFVYQPNPSAVDVIGEEEDIGVYQTINNNRADRKNVQQQYDDFDNENDSIEEDLLSPGYQEEVASPYDVNRPLKGKFMGDDVEVVGMQCMLAKALMGDDEDD